MFSRAMLWMMLLPFVFRAEENRNPKFVADIEAADYGSKSVELCLFDSVRLVARYGSVLKFLVADTVEISFGCPPEEPCSIDNPVKLQVGDEYLPLKEFEYLEKYSARVIGVLMEQGEVGSLTARIVIGQKALVAKLQVEKSHFVDLIGFAKGDYLPLIFAKDRPGVLWLVTPRDNCVYLSVVSLSLQ